MFSAHYAKGWKFFGYIFQSKEVAWKFVMWIKSRLGETFLVERVRGWDAESLETDTAQGESSPEQGVSSVN